MALRVHLGTRRRSARLGLIYDQLARQCWAERAAANLEGFSVEVAAMCLDPAILRMANNEFDRQRNTAKATQEA